MIFDSAQLTSLLADLAGVAGLVLSIYIFFANRRDRQPRLSIGIGIDREEYESASVEEYGCSPPLDMVFIDISNPSDRRIKVVSLQVEWLVRKSWIRKLRQSDIYTDFQSKNKMPFFLIPGDNATYFVDAVELSYWLADSKRLAGKVNIRAVVCDGTGNEYKSKWLLLDAMK